MQVNLLHAMLRRELNKYTKIYEKRCLLVPFIIMEMVQTTSVFSSKGLTS